MGLKLISASKRSHCPSSADLFALELWIHSDGPHFTNDILEYFFKIQFSRISKFVPQGPAHRKSALAQVIAWRSTSVKYLLELLMTLFTDACMRHRTPISLTWSNVEINMPMLSASLTVLHFNQVKVFKWRSYFHSMFVVRISSLHEFNGPRLAPHLYTSSWRGFSFIFWLPCQARKPSILMNRQKSGVISKCGLTGHIVLPL